MDDQVCSVSGATPRLATFSSLLPISKGCFGSPALGSTHGAWPLMRSLGCAPVARAAVRITNLNAEPGLAGAQGQVDLALGEVRTAPHGHDGAGLGVQADQRGVEAGGVRREDLVARVPGEGLQVEVLGGVDAQPAPEQLVVALLVGGAQDRRVVEQVVLDRLGEVGAGDGQLRRPLRGRRQHELRVVGLGLGRGEAVHGDQAVERLAEAVAGPLRADEGVVVGRVADEPAEEGALEHRELLDVLAEVDLGRRLQAVGVVPEVDGVQVLLEDVLLAHLLLEPAGQRRLDDLGLDGALGRGFMIRFLTTCWVIVEPPCATAPGRRWPGAPA